MSVVYLFHLLYAFHEMRKVLELGLLIIGRADWHIDLDGFFDSGHTTS
jgi:hypothetical protein